MMMSGWPNGTAARARRLVTVNHGTWRGAVRVLLGEVDFALGRLDRWVQPRGADVRRLVFVCLGNINRSAFAHAVAQARGVAVASIGLRTTTGAHATPQACRAARAQAIDLHGHRATDLSDYRYQAGDLLVAMEIRHVHALIAAGMPAESICLLGHWARPHRIHLHDPHTLDEAYFTTCFELISGAVDRLLADLRQLGSSA